jgi:pimeloyl-ACP methyl ester carboxylesterase
VPIAEINGQSIFYNDSGGGGPALLFSHGFLMDNTMFDPQVLALEGDPADYRCIRWDARGFGETACSTAFTYWDSADDAVALLDELAVDRAVWVGMSQGGFLSLRAALAHPDRVSALVLIDTTAAVEDPDKVEQYQGMLEVWQHGSDEEFDAVAQIVASLIIGDPVLSADWIERWKSRDRAAILYPGLCLLDRDDVSDRLGEITCPALVVHGTEDQAIPMDRAEALCAGLADCRGLVKVEGAAHASNLTHPDQVNPPLQKFLSTLA